MYTAYQAAKATKSVRENLQKMRSENVKEVIEKACQSLLEDVEKISKNSPYSMVAFDLIAFTNTVLALKGAEPVARDGEFFAEVFRGVRDLFLEAGYRVQKGMMGSIHILWVVDDEPFEPR